MNGPAREKLERIANNLPTRQRPDKGRVQTNRGEIYIAWGMGDDRWYGLWGADFDGGICQTVEFKEDTSEADVKQELLNTGYRALGILWRQNP